MVTIYFATNRNPLPPDDPTDFGKVFSPKGLTDLRFGRAEVTGPDFDRYTLWVAPEKLDIGLGKAKTGDFEGQVLGSRAIFDEVRREMTEGKQDCVISIHGFNYTFRDALQRTAQLKTFYASRPMVFFVFTWPSDGSMLPFKAYASDRDDARASGVALGRGMMKAADYLRGTRPEDYCGQSIHVFAHSMGNYALRHAVQCIKAVAGERVRRLFDHVLLFAADEDDDAFELDYKLKPLPDFCRRVTVYHNPSDRALMISDFTKGNPDRLGAGGPRNSRALPDKVTVVDCEPVVDSSKDIQAHQYYRLEGRVRGDVIDVLNDVSPADIGGREYIAETRSYRLRPRARRAGRGPR